MRLRSALFYFDVSEREKHPLFTEYFWGERGNGLLIVEPSLSVSTCALECVDWLLLPPPPLEKSSGNMLPSTAIWSGKNDPVNEGCHMHLRMMTTGNKFVGLDADDAWRCPVF